MKTVLVYISNSFRRFLLTLSLVVVSLGFSQSDKPVASIQSMVRFDGEKVLVRWAPISSNAWLKSNTAGYRIERFTISQNGQLLDPPLKKVLTPLPLKPAPVEQWESLAAKSDYAAIVAQALYGDSFQLEEMQGGLAQIINKSREIEQRFSFGLFAADMDFEAAKLASLGYEDTTIEKGTEYLYKIMSLVPEETLEIRPALVSIKTKTSEKLPKPIDLLAVAKDKNILLTWEYELYKSTYTSYYLERSEDGTNFSRLGDTPLVNLNDRPEAPAKRMYYIDTLSQNNKEYHYRVQGISPFGEKSPYSDIVTASGISKLIEVAHIDRHDFDKNGNLQLYWTFKQSAQPQLKSFELNWAKQEKGPYKRIQEDIAVTARKTTVINPEPSNYYSITAVSKDNQRTTSFIAYVQTIDSVAPAKPVGITGVVDTLGIVKLQWDANTEKDLLGYRIFRGNLEKEELSQITVAPIATNTFTDTVQVKSLNNSIFYQLVAVDERYNMSEYSQKFKLAKPDVIPPSSPIFKTYKVTDKGIRLDWIGSTSSDVSSHTLYRQVVNTPEKGWTAVFETATATSFTDQKTEEGVQYRYAIFAEDLAGLRSAASSPITVTAQKSTSRDMIKGFTAIADRTALKIDLSWRKLPQEVSEVLIYKSKKEGKPVLWKQMPNSKNKLSDTHISPGHVYVYQIKAVTKQGNHSNLEIIEVNY